jgi:hypothetical protein
MTSSSPLTVTLRVCTFPLSLVHDFMPTTPEAVRASITARSVQCTINWQDDMHVGEVVAHEVTDEHWLATMRVMNDVLFAFIARTGMQLAPEWEFHSNLNPQPHKRKQPTHTLRSMAFCRESRLTGAEASSSATEACRSTREQVQSSPPS